jgi:site-specific DNA-methyltransferase (adenine-specific)/modification methylase
MANYKRKPNYQASRLNKVFCADCLSFMKDIPDKSIDMILCDLPIA